MARPVAVTVVFDLPVPPSRAFDLVTQVDLPEAFHATRVVPAVTGTTPLEGAWDQPGARRLVHVAGGGQLTEETVAVDPPSRFTYRISDFTFSLRHLVREGRGSFRFAADTTGTRVTWTYEFTARGPLHRPLVGLFARRAWRPYMAAAAQRFASLSGAASP